MSVDADDSLMQRDRKQKTTAAFIIYNLSMGNNECHYVDTITKIIYDGSELCF